MWPSTQKVISSLFIFIGTGTLWLATLVVFYNFKSTTSPVIHFDLITHSTPTDLHNGEILAITSYTSSGFNTDPQTAQNVYPWLRSHALLVEPFRLTTLQVKTHERDEGSVELNTGALSWTITNEADADTSFYSGDQVEHMFTTLATYGIQACVSTEQGNTGDTPATSSQCIRSVAICRYVRRELRSLAPDDRNVFLDAMHTMIEVPMAEGMARFGPDYRDWSYFVMLHHMASSPQSGDQMHDGMGFLTQHSALSGAFEIALQAVAPAVSLAWWDLTLDWAMVVTEFNGTFDDRFWSMDMWQSNWFGRPDNQTRTITEGRFAYLAADSPALGSMADVTLNAYGFMRAPWNYNRSPWMTRAAEMNGMSVFYNCAFSSKLKCTSGPWPSCESHLNAVSSLDHDSFQSFGWYVNYDPHAHAHVVLGGGWGLNASRLEGILGPGDVKALQAKVWSLRNVWRTQHSIADTPVVSFPTVCSMDAPESACHARCDLELLRNNVTVLEDVWSAVNDWMDTYGTYNAASKLDAISILCGTSFSMGEQAESASPLDPTFWPIHPTIERLWQWRKLLGGFADESWTYSTAGSCVLGGRCYGHQPNDLTLAPGKFLVEGVFEMQLLSNMDYYAQMDPFFSNTSYVYSHFSNQHCADIGFGFPYIV